MVVKRMNWKVSRQSFSSISFGKCLPKARPHTPEHTPNSSRKSKSGAKIKIGKISFALHTRITETLTSHARKCYCRWIKSRFFSFHPLSFLWVRDSGLSLSLVKMSSRAISPEKKRLLTSACFPEWNFADIDFQHNTHTRERESVELQAVKAKVWQSTDDGEARAIFMV